MAKKLNYPEEFKVASRLYRCWSNMKNRCYNPHCEYFPHYGGKNIRVCKDWHNYQKFLDWAVQSGYKSSLTLDRIDNSKGYSPENCRWVTMLVQQRNRTNNLYLEYKGEKKTIAEWSEFTGIKRSTLAQRYYTYGWSIEKTLSN